MTLLDNMPHTCTIKRPQHVQDDLGGGGQVLVTFKSGVRCWVQPAGSRVVFEYAKRDMVATHVLYFQESPGLEIGDYAVPDAGCYAAGDLLELLGDSNAGAGVIGLHKGVFEKKRPATIPPLS